MDVQLYIQPGVRDMALVTVGWLRNQCCQRCHAAGLGVLVDGCAELQAAAWAQVEKGIEDPSTAVSCAMALGK